ncbi:hypothetical protein GCM10022384_34190 [Streptomyces marokkonensis]|uniref:Integral membrane protein n=1 Tax=Streptomyces marokkonensis TaxID=324855 RepID=A0ABP7QH45_9ACTN
MREVDPTAPATTRRPAGVTLAVTLLALGTLTAVVAATASSQAQTPAQTPMTALWLACVWFAVRAGRGRRTARTTASCLTVLTLLLAVPFALVDPLYGGSTLLVAAALAVPGLFLLYAPAAEAYVRTRQGGERSET